MHDMRDATQRGATAYVAQVRLPGDDYPELAAALESALAILDPAVKVTHDLEAHAYTISFSTPVDFETVREVVQAFHDQLQDTWEPPRESLVRAGLAQTA